MGPEAFSLRYVAGCEGPVKIESEWTVFQGEDLSSGRTAPLKPKPGLSGPPVKDFRFQKQDELVNRTRASNFAAAVPESMD